MKIQIIDGEVTEVSQQDWQAFEAWRKEQAKDWPQQGDQYFTVLHDGDVTEYGWVLDGIDTGCQSIGNIYRTEAEALAQVEKLKAKARIDKYIADNGLAFVPDWEDAGQNKIVLLYSHGHGKFLAEVYGSVQFQGYVFAASVHAQQVIDNCTDDLKTIFGVK